MLEMLANPVQGQAQAGQRPPMFGMVKINTLVEYRGKSDEEIRAELALFDVRKKEALQKRRDELVKALASVDAQLNVEEVKAEAVEQEA